VVIQNHCESKFKVIACAGDVTEKNIVTATKISLHKVEYNFPFLIHLKIYKTPFLPEGNAEHFFHSPFLTITA